MGKTAPAIMAAKTPALVVCPASLVLNWKREIEMWRPAEADEFIVRSYADRQLPGMVEALPTIDFSSLVVDEVHYIKNQESQRSKTVGALIRRIGKRGQVVALSGTLVPNRPIELWPLLYAMRVYREGWDVFARRYCGAFTDERGQLVARGATRLPELRRLLEPHVLRYTKEDVLPELPPKTWRVIALDLPLDEREKNFSLADLKRMDAHVAFEAFSDVLRIHGERKVPRVLDHVRDALEHEQKVILFGHHRSVIGALHDGLRDFHPVVIQGKHTQRQRQRAVDAFQESKKHRVVIGNIQAAGVGLTLTASKRVIFAEGSWVPAELDQGADRAHRSGQRDAVLCDLLTIHGSIDEHMLRRALEKQRVVKQIVPDSDFE